MKDFLDRDPINPRNVLIGGLVVLLAGLIAPFMSTGAINEMTCITKTDTDANSTPIPRLDASIMEDTRSSVAFVIRTELSPVSPA